MGVPLPPVPVPATGLPPAGDQANAVVSGKFTAALQASLPFCFYGAFNVAMWGTVSTTLQTFAGSSTVGVASVTGLGVGESVVSTLVPAGTVLVTAQVGGANTTQIGGLTAAQIAAIQSGTDANAVFSGGLATPTLTVLLQKSYDGGNTWITCGVGGGGTPASYQFNGSGGLTDSVSFVVGEPEKGCAYRLLCTAYTSGTLNYRMSATGLAATTWGVPIG